MCGVAVVDEAAAAARRLHVQQHAREEYQTVHVSGPLVRLAAVLHGRRVLSCEHSWPSNLKHGDQNRSVSPLIAERRVLYDRRYR